MLKSGQVLDNITCSMSWFISSVMTACWSSNHTTLFNQFDWSKRDQHCAVLINFVQMVYRVKG